MTRQMADDEVLRPEVVAWRLRWAETDADSRTESTGSITFDREQAALNRVEQLCAEWPNTATAIEPLITLDSHNAAVAALQAERDALRACDESMQQTNYELHQQIREHKAALEALRGQVAGLVEKWRLEIEEYDTQNVGSSDPEDWMSGHRECLGELLAINSSEFIKERMG